MKIGRIRVIWVILFVYLTAFAERWDLEIKRIACEFVQRNQKPNQLVARTRGSNRSRKNAKQKHYQKI